MPDNLNDVFKNTFDRIKSLENRPRVSGAQGWSLQTPSDDLGVVNPGGSITLTWPQVELDTFENSGFTRNPLDFTQILISNPGRYAFEVDFDVQLQATGSPDAGPFLLEMTNPLDITNMRWQVPLITGAVDIPFTYVAMGIVPNPDTAITLTLTSHATGYPIVVDNTLYGSGIALSVHYLGPVHGPVFP